MRYVTYTRSESGTLTREHDAREDLSAADRADRYPHAEPLLGWPERTVYWTRETGPATGVAPLR